MTEAADASSSDRQEDGIYIVRDLDQLKVLVDPLRLRILEQLCLKARTTKQVADLLGEPPTKLYHHVEALEGAGLIRLVRTRPKRGTLEKYYQAIARGFRADPRLLAGSVPGGDEGDWPEIAAQLLENTANELRQLAPLDLADVEEGIIAQLTILASQEDLAELRRQLDEWVERVRATSERAASAVPTSTFRLTVAFFPLPQESEPTDQG